MQCLYLKVRESDAERRAGDLRRTPPPARLSGKCGGKEPLSEADMEKLQ